MEWEAIQNTIVRVAMWAMLILVLLALAYYGVGELLEDYFAPDPWEIFALALLILTGCGGNDPANPSTESSGTYRIVDVNAKGRSVTCISWKNGYAGGLSCDWAGAR